MLACLLLSAKLDKVFCRYAEMQARLPQVSEFCAPVL
jgi:hypothetical protein